MAGRGPLPKPDHLRVRGNKEKAPVRNVEHVPVAQPALPDDVEWHPRTVEWWRMWGEHPLTEGFTAADWSELLDTALVHTAFWGGNLRAAAELRQRTMLFGATPEARARLRIAFADADAKDAARPTRTPPQAAKTRYGVLKAVE